MPQFTTDFWHRQDEHITRSIREFLNEGCMPDEHRRDAESRRRLARAKASYDLMLAELAGRERTCVERIMAQEMRLLLLSIANAAGRLAESAASRASPRTDVRHAAADANRFKSLC